LNMLAFRCFVRRKAQATIYSYILLRTPIGNRDRLVVDIDR